MYIFFAGPGIGSGCFRRTEEESKTAKDLRGMEMTCFHQCGLMEPLNYCN